MYERSRVNIKVEPHSTFTFTHDTHTLPLFYHYAHKNNYYTTVEIHLKRSTPPLWEPTYLPPSPSPKMYKAFLKIPLLGKMCNQALDTDI